MVARCATMHPDRIAGVIYVDAAATALPSLRYHSALSMIFRSLALRALTAVLLVAGFYLLALGMAAGLLWLAWWDITEKGGHAQVIFFGGGIGAMILWAILPRRIPYDIPGPALIAEDQPELFEVIAAVAQATGQRMPTEVYLAHEVNAGVLRVGGLLGFRTRRVLELGLPLLQSLPISQFRAVLAHEFGHYHGGDTRLAPLVYRTRDAIGRTVNNLVDDDGFIHKPFVWYGNFFLRVTQAISRAQELAADRLSAQVAGAKNATAALVAVEGAAAAHESYWHSEVMPLVSQGYRPPLVSGFAQFTSVTTISGAPLEDGGEESAGRRKECVQQSSAATRARRGAGRAASRRGQCFGSFRGHAVAQSAAARGGARSEHVRRLVRREDPAGDVGGGGYARLSPRLARAHHEARYHSRRVDASGAAVDRKEDGRLFRAAEAHRGGWRADQSRGGDHRRRPGRSAARIGLGVRRDARPTDCAHPAMGGRSSRSRSCRVCVPASSPPKRGKDSAATRGSRRRRSECRFRCTPAG